MEQEKSFLGKGWAFPVQFEMGSNSAFVKMSSDVDDIIGSLTILFSTRIRERILQPGYGCDLQNYLFEPMTTSVKALIEDQVTTAIYLYEPRIKPENVALVTTDTEGVINIYVEYTIISTNTRHNIVYPFYFTEGTNVIQ